MHSRERLLPLAVLQKAFEDALNDKYISFDHTDPWSIKDSEVIKAREFLTSNSKHFQKICWMCDCDPDWVKERYYKMMSQKRLEKSVSESFNDEG